jgi:PAS domain S-box-containing protein
VVSSNEVEGPQNQNELRGKPPEWFEVMLASIGDAVIATDTNSRITYLNRIAEEMSGWSAGEAQGKPLAQVFRLINENTGRAADDPVTAVLKSGQVLGLPSHSALVRRNNDSISVEDSVAPIRDTSGTILGAVIVFRDVTSKRQIERTLRESKDKLQAADQRKDEFLATLAHELRNPLAPIRQAALIGKSSISIDTQTRWCFDLIERQSNHMALLLDDLLDISLITRDTLALRSEMIELSAVVDAAVETARPAIEAKGHVLSVELPPERIHFAADPMRLGQVLSNLLTNAAKYTPPGGRIELRATRAGDTLGISVTDNGIGIEPRALESVFDMFSQAQPLQYRSGGGLGIGLYLARGLLRLHHGTIMARSAGPGRGSEFVVNLPIRVWRDDSPSAQFDFPAGTHGPQRVLIADDNRDAADSLAVLVRLEGHEVTVVYDGEDALAAINTTKPQIAVLDIGMPRMSGYEVARQVRAGIIGPAVTLIAVTGWGQHKDKMQALGAGFNHHLTKPVETGRLLELLRLNRYVAPSASA